jgi:hypothetical protein
VEEPSGECLGEYACFYTSGDNGNLLSQWVPKRLSDTCVRAGPGDGSTNGAATSGRVSGPEFGSSARGKWGMRPRFTDKVSGNSRAGCQGLAQQMKLVRPERIA